MYLRYDTIKNCGWISGIFLSAFSADFIVNTIKKI